MEQIWFLLESLGPWTGVFFAVCLGLGMAFARVSWKPQPSGDVALLRDENSRLRRQLRETKKSSDQPAPAQADPAKSPAILPPSGPDSSAGEPEMVDLVAETILPVETTPSRMERSPLGDLYPDRQRPVPAPPASQVVPASDRQPINFENLLQDLFLDEPARLDPRLGVVYAEEPERIDPLGMIKGVGPRAELALNELGVYRFKQIAHWTGEIAHEISERLPFDHVQVKRHRWRQQARELWSLVTEGEEARFEVPEQVDHESKLLTDFSGENAKVHPEFGVIYRDAPENVDALHRIDGIGPLIEEQLHALGIHYFKQIANWSRQNVVHLADQVERTPQRILDEKWIPQARLLQWECYSACPEWGVANPTLSDYIRKQERDYAGENVRADGDMGIVYKAQPEVVDRLDEIGGVAESMVETLNARGVWRFRQIADWSEANVRAFANRLSITPQRIFQEGWIAQATQLATLARKRAVFAGESFRNDPRLGIVYYMEPEYPDQLYAIDGLSEDMAARLNQEGVFTFKQVALWEPENVAAAAELLGLEKAEISRANWVAQARELHEIKYHVAL